MILNFTLPSEPISARSASVAFTTAMANLPPDPSPCTSSRSSSCLHSPLLHQCRPTPASTAPTCHGTSLSPRLNLLQRPTNGNVLEFQLDVDGVLQLTPDSDLSLLQFIPELTSLTNFPLKYLSVLKMAPLYNPFENDQFNYLFK